MTSMTPFKMARAPVEGSANTQAVSNSDPGTKKFPLPMTWMTWMTWINVLMVGWFDRHNLQGSFFNFPPPKNLEY